MLGVTGPSEFLLDPSITLGAFEPANTALTATLSIFFCRGCDLRLVMELLGLHEWM